MVDVALGGDVEDARGMTISLSLSASCIFPVFVPLHLKEQRLVQEKRQGIYNIDIYIVLISVCCWSGTRGSPSFHLSPLFCRGNGKAHRIRWQVLRSICLRSTLTVTIFSGLSGETRCWL